MFLQCYIMWPAPLKAANFWTVLRIWSHVPSRDSHLQSLAISYVLFISARHPPAQGTGADDGGRVLDGSEHLLSRALVILSRLMYALSLYLYVPSTGTGNRRGRRRPISGRFWASTVTCPREPVIFSRSLDPLSPSAPPAVVPAGKCNMSTSPSNTTFDCGFQSGRAV
jgi:hypothetical protein